jgi:hypothetical protein
LTSCLVEIYKGFEKLIKGKNFRCIFKFFNFLNFLSQNRMNRHDCWGPDGRLDTNINEIDFCHILMSYASFVIIWHLMSYDAYDINIWHKSIWLFLVSKRPSGPQQSSLFIRFWLNIFIKIEKLKYATKNFPFIDFSNPLYISTKQEVKFGLTSKTARNLILFANLNRICFWMGISCKLIHFPKKGIFGTRYCPGWFNKYFTVIIRSPCLLKSDL